MEDHKEDDLRLAAVDDKKLTAVAGGEGRLFIKLKISRPSGGGDEASKKQKEEKEERVDLQRFCSICNKSFSSGKALGGHMRIHIHPPPSTAAPNLTKINNKKKPRHHRPPESFDNGGCGRGDPEPSDTTDGSGSRGTGGGGGGGGGGSSGGTGGSGGSPECPVCGKGFWSDKSLFGHMRCHPDRRWRGIRPPPGFLPNAKANKDSTTSSSTVSSDANRHDHEHHVTDSAMTSAAAAVVDLSHALRGVSWSTTDKRGRGPRTSPSSPPLAVVPASEEDELAVRDLLWLAQGHHQQEHQQHQQQQLQQLRPVDQTLASKKRIRETDHHHRFSNNRLGRLDDQYKCSSELPEQHPPHGSEDEDHNRDDRREGANLGKTTTTRMINKRTMKKRRKMRDLETVANVRNATLGPDGFPKPSADERFKCTTCNKSFPTHQALGGHRSSHNKLPKHHHHHHHTILSSSYFPSDPSGPSDEPESINYEAQAMAIAIPAATTTTTMTTTTTTTPPREEETINHLCKVCSKTFATGQALGGHMRCHYWPADAPQLQPPAAALSSPTRDGRSGGKVVLNFDLNEIPAMEEGEEEEARGGGEQWDV